MSATINEIQTNAMVRRELTPHRDPQTKALPRTSWPDSHPLGYDVWNGMTLCAKCACAKCACTADCCGDLWDPENDYFLLGVRSVTTPCQCGNCGDLIREPAVEGPLCCWCDAPSEGLVDSDSPACGMHFHQYGGEHGTPKTT